MELSPNEKVEALVNGGLADNAEEAALMLVDMGEIDAEPWECEHGYWQGRECPDCDSPTYLPPVLDS